MKNYSPVSCGINRLTSYLISKQARLQECFKSVLVVVKLVIAQITANKQHNKKNHICCIFYSEYSKRAVDIYYENGDHFKQEYGYSLSTLGSSHRYLGQYVQAEKCLKEALKIFRSVDSPSKLRVTILDCLSAQGHLIQILIINN